MKTDNIHGPGYCLVMLTAREATAEQRERARREIRRAFNERDELADSLQSARTYITNNAGRLGEACVPILAQADAILAKVRAP